MRTVLIMFALCASACGRFAFDPLGDAGDDDVLVSGSVPSWTSGTRLRAKLADFGGGAVEVIGWFDSLLGVECKVEGVSPAGDHYCFPVATNVVYADAGCTMRLALWSPASGVPLPSRAYEVQLTGGELVKTYYPLEGELSGVTYYSGDPTACYGPYPQGAARIFEVGPEIDPTTFVRTQKSRIGTGRLHPEGWQGDDGSAYYDTLYDGIRGLPCTFMDTTDGKRCVTRADGTFYYADASCTVPLSDPTQAGDGEGINYVEPCGLAHRHERGTPYTGQAYQSYNGVCSSSSKTGLVTLGAEVAPDIFVPSSPTLGTETGRLVGVGLVALDGTRVRTAWRDTMRGNEACGLSTGSLFGTKCLPYAMVNTLGYYTDAACSIPLASVVPEMEADGACPAKYIFELDARGQTLHPVNTSAPSPTTQYSYGASCYAGTFEPMAGHVVGGPVISFDSFASATERVE